MLSNTLNVNFFIHDIIQKIMGHILKNKQKNKRVCHCVKSVQIRSFFWSVFFRIRTGYEDLRSKSPSSVQLRENTDQKKLRNRTLFTQCHKYCVDETINDVSQLCFTTGAVTGNEKEVQTFIFSICG